MSKPALACVLALVAAVAGARAEEPPAPPPAAAPVAPAPTTPPPAPQPAKTPPQTTAVHGTLPDLEGRWLLLFDMVMDPQRRTIPAFIEIDRADGEVRAREHFVELPDAMRAQVEEGNQQATYWQPSPEQIAEIDRQWTDLPDSGRGVAEAANELWGQDAFDDAMKKEPELTGAVWVFRQTYTFAPGGQRPVKHVNVFGAMKPEGSGWRGNAVEASLVTAPFPIPITYKGTFRMIRVDAAPERAGWLARLLAAFRGCGG
jgi:hypothetical protein